MARLKIGVLGGIGPEATGTFYLKLIKRFQSEGLIKDNKDFPQIIVNSIPAPELIFDKIDNRSLDLYIKGLKELDKLYPDFIVMVCNTIHLFYGKLQSEIKTELINLRDEVYYALKKENIRKISIIGTPSTINLGLYKFKDIEYYNPNKEEMKILSKAIYNFNKGINKNKQKRMSLKIVNRCLSSGSEMVLLGCTEFAVMFNNEDIPKKDTIDILVDAVIKRYKRILLFD